MIELSVNNLTKYFGANKIFEHIGMDVQTGERVGLIGPNGCGKTTLMKILTGEEEYQEGSIALRKGIKLGYLNQLPDYPNTMKVIDVMTLAFEALLAIRKKMTDYEKQFEVLDGLELERALSAYGSICQKFESQGGYDIETRLGMISEGLNISESFKQKDFGLLSGGEKTRVELAKILLEAPDVLLLDEPSNHLDMKSIEWLEEFLKTYKGTAVIISHDRYFLDRVVTRILDMGYDGMTVFQGNYSYYVIEKERRFLLEMKYYEQQQKKIKRMEDQIKRYRVWGAMRDSDKMYRKAKELEKRLTKVNLLDRPVFDNAKVKLKFNINDRSGKRVIELSDISKSFNQELLFENVAVDLFVGESLCLLGDNGTGKSTLLKMIVQEALENEYTWLNDQDVHNPISKDSGTIKIGTRLKVGYLPQEILFADESKTILTYFQEMHELTISDARRELAKVLFTKDDVNKVITSLSGGEKSRLKLCSLMFDQVNLMILDEPTNHLDIDSREILEENLINYSGTIIFVSHDRYFIAKIANRMAAIVNKGLVYYAGNYDYYREAIAKGIGIEVIKSKPVKKEADKVRKTTTKKPSQKYHLELEKLEIRIEALEQEQKEVTESMAEHATDVERLYQLHERTEELKVDLEVCYKRWEELTEIVNG